MDIFFAPFVYKNSVIVALIAGRLKHSFCIWKTRRKGRLWLISIKSFSGRLFHNNSDRPCSTKRKGGKKKVQKNPSRIDHRTTHIHTQVEDVFACVCFIRGETDSEWAVHTSPVSQFKSHYEIKGQRSVSWSLIDGWVLKDWMGEIRWRRFTTPQCWRT